MRLPKTQGQSCPQPAEAGEIQKQKEQRSGEREGPTQPLGVYQATPLKKQGWASVGRDTPQASKCCSLSDWPRVSSGLPPTPPRMKKRKLPETCPLPAPHSSTPRALGRVAPR